MKLLKVLLSFFLVITATVSSEQIRLAGEVELPLVEYWQLNSTLDNYPFQIISEGDEAELLIFKSILPENETITDNTTLKGAVDQVIQDIVLTLPNGQLSANTGLFNEDHVNFILDFTSTDSASGQILDHRLAGYIYRHPDGQQYLFTLWGKTIPSAAPLYLDDLIYMQDNFKYIGPYTNNVYQTGYSTNYYFVVGLLVVLMVLLTIYARRKKSFETNNLDN